MRRICDGAERGYGRSNPLDVFLREFLRIVRGDRLREHGEDDSPAGRFRGVRLRFELRTRIEFSHNVSHARRGGFAKGETRRSYGGREIAQTRSDVGDYPSQMPSLIAGATRAIFSGLSEKPVRTKPLSRPLANVSSQPAKPAGSALRPRTLL